MRSKAAYLPYHKTGYFSRIVTDYLDGNEHTLPLIQFSPDEKGIKEAILKRKQFPVNRNLLVDVLSRQYASVEIPELVQKNIELLRQEDTFTVCTAHQPNLLTGYLYFIYKIIHAIKLSEELNDKFPEHHFVPVYYMGSEDNDLEELGTFKYNGQKFTWDGNGQKGAVGRMKTQGLKKLFDELLKQLGPPGEHLEKLKVLITKAYLEHETISAATRWLVNELFGRYGLIILDPDDADLKKQFIQVMKDDLLQHNAEKVINEHKAFSDHYKLQAVPRPINLFYLRNGLRERIEKRNDECVVLNEEIKWTEAGLIKELEENPERFSPNVILRGLYQETILPDVAFIGGGAEVAYWLQLKPLFDHYRIFYPAIHLRQSVLWISKTDHQLREKTGLSVDDIFKEEAALITQYVLKNTKDDLDTSKEMQEIERLLLRLKQKAAAIDPTLSSSAEAVLVKMQNQAERLQQKMLRAEKKKMQVETDRIRRLKAHLFPGNSLQERTENFISYYLLYGDQFFEILKQHIQPFQNQFLVSEELE